MSIKLFCKILYKSKFLHEIIAVAIKLNLISYRRDSPCGCPTQAPSDEGAVILSKMTEGEKAINGKFSLFLLPSRLRRATYCPLAVSRFCLCGLERRTKSTAAQQMLPLSATGGGRICCPSEGAYIIEWKKY